MNASVVNTSHQFIGIVKSIIDLTVSIKQSMTDLITSTLMIMLWLLISPFFFLILLYFIFRLRIQANSKIEITTENYKKKKLILEHYDINRDGKSIQLPINHFPYIFRPVIWLINVLIRQMTKNINKLEVAFQVLDQDGYDGTIMRHIPQDELWENRPKAYEYLA